MPRGLTDGQKETLRLIRESYTTVGLPDDALPNLKTIIARHNSERPGHEIGERTVYEYRDVEDWNGIRSSKRDEMLRGGGEWISAQMSGGVPRDEIDVEFLERYNHLLQTAGRVIDQGPAETAKHLLVKTQTLMLIALEGLLTPERIASMSGETLIKVINSLRHLETNFTKVIGDDERIKAAQTKTEDEKNQDLLVDVGLLADLTRTLNKDIVDPETFNKTTQDGLKRLQERDEDE